VIRAKVDEGGLLELVVPGDPDKSLLIQAVRQNSDLKMPKAASLRKKILTIWLPGLRRAHLAGIRQAGDCGKQNGEYVISRNSGRFGPSSL